MGLGKEMAVSKSLRTLFTCTHWSPKQKCTEKRTEWIHYVPRSIPQHLMNFCVNNGFTHVVNEATRNDNMLDILS